MIVKLLTDHHLEFLSLKGGCRGSPESTLVKMSHAAAHISSCCDWEIKLNIFQADNSHELSISEYD